MNFDFLWFWSGSWYQREIWFVDVSETSKKAEKNWLLVALAITRRIFGEFYWLITNIH